MNQKEYVVELNGTYFIPKQYKDYLKGLDLNREFYRIDENNNIQIKYMSFIAWGVDEYDALERDLIKNIHQTLTSNRKRDDNQYFQYSYIIKTKLTPKDLKLNYCYLRATGRHSPTGDPIPFVDYDIVKPSNYFKGQISHYMSRILISKKKEELNHYYDRFLEEIHNENMKNEGFKERFMLHIEKYYQNHTIKIKNNIIIEETFNYYNKQFNIKMLSPNKLVKILKKFGCRVIVEGIFHFSIKDHIYNIHEDNDNFSNNCYVDRALNLTEMKNICDKKIKSYQTNKIDLY